MQENFIVDHAIANVWCEPSQDTQLIIQPARITPAPGVIGQWTVMWQPTNLPDLTSRWHIFQVSQIHPLIAGMLPLSMQWVPFSQSCNTQRMVCDIYTEFGVNLPRFDTFYQYTQDRNLIIAVRKNDKLKYDFDHDPIYLRVYSNTWFEQDAENQPDNRVYVQGVTAKFIADILTLQTAQATYQAKPGKVYSFVNGAYVDQIDLLTMQVGDTAEFVYDASIYTVVDFNVGTLPTFTSDLDDKIKYLLHYTGPGVDRIDFQDDIDVFLIQKKPNNREIGLYYHKNSITGDAMRNLTHRDYSVVVPYVVRYVEKMQEVSQLETPVDPTQWVMRLHIRQAGFMKPLVFENNRIHELYKLAEADIVRAMVGIDATVPVWRAAALEASGYTEVMRSTYRDITPELVQEAYGYNAMAKITGDNPNPTFLQSSQLVCNVPYNYQRLSTAYEYGANGLLIGWYIHPIGSIYKCSNPNAALVEFVHGLGGTLLDERYPLTVADIGLYTDFRIYTSPKDGTGQPTNVWTDVTDTPNLYTVVDGVVTWLSQDDTLYPIIRTDKRVLCYDILLPMTRGQLTFSLTHQQLRNGNLANWIMQIPMGQIDLFMNGRSLIRDLDYFVDFPKITIACKEYLVAPLTQNQKIHVRFVGFCTADMQIDPPTDSGFIKFSLMSEDHQYDLRDDRVLRIVLDGALKTRGDLVFAEDTQGISVPDPINGRPYQIRDMIVPLGGLMPEETYKLRAEARVIDQQVSDYLTIKLPQPEPEGQEQIMRQYQIFSPFCCKLIYDLADGTLVIPNKVGAYGRTYVGEVCAPYESLLAADPVRAVDIVDQNYVDIQPHSLFTVIRIPFTAYKFMGEVVLYYTNNLVKLSPFLAII